jgi:hypothetical protein
MRLYMKYYAVMAAYVAIAVIGGYKLYHWFPRMADFSARPLITMVIVVALVATIVWAFWPKNYDWYHVAGGMVAAVVATITLLKGKGSSTGWGTMAGATGIVLVALVWVGVGAYALYTTRANTAPL